MSGQLTIGGKAEGPTGQIDIGPVTITGSNVIGAVDSLELASGDNTISVPKGAVAVVIVFTAIYEGPEVKIRTNLNPLDGGLPVTGQGFAVFPLITGTTSIILHAASATTLVGLIFI